MLCHQDAAIPKDIKIRTENKNVIYHKNYNSFSYHKKNQYSINVYHFIQTFKQP